MEFADLVLDDGNLVRLECPDEHVDDFYDSLEHAMKRKDFWSPNQWDGCNAEFLGHRMGRVNMAKVVGML